ncbi:MAG: hypothetical protein MJD61_07210 [Proteobacteria bacterium]|nr:hypothetical protein [Pseudomonadota bacterium]
MRKGKLIGLSCVLICAALCAIGCGGEDAMAPAGVGAAGGMAAAGTGAGGAGTGGASGSAAGAGGSAGGAGSGGAGGGAAPTWTQVFAALDNGDQRRCSNAGCHGKPTMAPKGLSFTDATTAYEAFVNKMAMCANKVLVTPSDTAKSYLVEKLKPSPTCDATMPLGMTALAASDLKQLTDWIEAGAMNN